MISRRWLLATLAAFGSGGCLHYAGQSRTHDGEGQHGAATPPPPGARYFYTHPQATGNRHLTGAGNVRDAAPTTFDVEGRARWLVAHPGPDGLQVTVVSSARASRWGIRGREAKLLAVSDWRSDAMPPVVGVTDDSATPVSPPGRIAPYTTPLVVERDGSDARLLYLTADGTLVVAGETTTRFRVDAPQDARLAAVGDGRVALYAERSTRYRHGALGDGVEGTTLLVVDPFDPAVVARTTVGPPEVFEGLQPLVADLDGDGDPEIVTTVADSSDGARIALVSPDGERLATGPIHEPGWRHQLAVAPFGPDGRPELAVVRKPHVEHVLEFYRFDGASLEVAATVDGFSSHTYGSRNLGGALAADLDADGNTELLLPTTDRTELAAVRRTAGGASVVWRQALDGSLRTNLTGLGLTDGGLAVAAGTDAGVHVWTG
jgi:hypothetical protein